MLFATVASLHVVYEDHGQPFLICPWRVPNLTRPRSICSDSKSSRSFRFSWLGQGRLRGASIEMLGCIGYHEGLCDDDFLPQLEDVCVGQQIRLEFAFARSFWSGHDHTIVAAGITGCSTLTHVLSTTTTTTSPQLLVSSNARERDKGLLRGILFGSVWNGFDSDRSNGEMFFASFVVGLMVMDTYVGNPWIP